MKIVSVNIERNRHFDTVLPFLEKENADVVCLQEVVEPFLDRFIKALGMHATFVPFAKISGWEEEVEGCTSGIALLSKKPHKTVKVAYYQGSLEKSPVLHKKDIIPGYRETIPHGVLVAECFDKDQAPFIIGTTHFTYTVDGKPNEVQEIALKKLLDILAPYPDLILTGDFNIPRANGLYKKLCRYFTDNIPEQIDTSLDPVLHRVKGLKFVVDYFWTRGAYLASNIRLQNGISDHYAVIGEVEKAPLYGERVGMVAISSDTI